MSSDALVSTHAQALLNRFEEISKLTLQGRSDALRPLLEERSALWIHSEDMTKPHVQLRSLLHSNGFIDTLRALTEAEFCFAAAYGLAKLIRMAYQGKIDWVIGSDHAGAVFSQNVAIHLGARHDFTEKGRDNEQIWSRFQIKEGEVVLQVEELLTTAGTLERVRKGLQNGNEKPVEFAPVTGVLVDRSNIETVGDTTLVKFSHYEIENFEPATCKYCLASSPLIRDPKRNWDKLTA